MKQNFDSVGISHIETQILSLTPSGRRIETDYLRAQPLQWIHEQFDLTDRQSEQLQSMDSLYLQRIAAGVADSWDRGRLITFYKEEPTVRQVADKSPKDIIFSRQSTQSQTFGQEPDEALEQVAIWIRYRL
ncbi:hypothetical protein [Sphingobacterium tabacisoli]|uniref:Uncharacterized protein n=1 Tax=Sphingobacterium tabacisoli TaxID=2044855 RepID=A0ABW5L6B7_9SPHI|nr:hypothetical protein [Sphingobacterium tabacisoli]